MGEPYRQEQRNAIYALQMREAVIRMTHEGTPDPEIARTLGQSVRTIRRYRKQADDLALEARALPEITYDLRADLPRDPEAQAKRGAGPGPHVRSSWKHPRSRQSPPNPLPTPGPPLRTPISEANQRASSDPTPHRTSTRTIVRIDPETITDPPDVVALRSRCLDLRKAMRTFPEMATILGISEPDVRAHTAYALRNLQDSQTTTADLERRLMVEQVDDMIRAVRPATVEREGKDPDLDSVDRMLKLMDRKSKLLGLDQAESVDIMIRLQTLATEGNYDMVELMDLAKDTLSKHKIQMPMHLVQGRSDDDPDDEIPVSAPAPSPPDPEEDR